MNITPTICILIFTAAGAFGSVPEIGTIGCQFSTSSCQWRPFREKSDWKISNSTQNKDVPDSGQNFLVLRGSTDKAKNNMIVSPHFRNLPRNFSLRLNIFCSGNPKLRLSFREEPFERMHFLTQLKCPHNGSWEQTEAYSEVEPDDETGNGLFQIVLSGIVQRDEVIALQDLNFRDETSIVTEISTSSTQHDIINDTVTNASTTENGSVSISTSSGQDTQTSTGATFTEADSTGSTDSINSSHSSTVYPTDTIFTSDEPEITSADESTAETLSKEITSTVDSTTVNGTYSVSGIKERIFTGYTITGHQVWENHSDASSISPKETSFSESENDSYLTIIVSTETDPTPKSTTDPVNEAGMENSPYLWKTVFISTLAAFFIYSLLSLILCCIRKQMRRRKQWVLGRRSQNTIGLEEPEGIALSVFKNS